MCKELVLSGTPFERGKIYGAACRDEIRHSIQSYSQLFAERRGISWQQARILYPEALCMCGNPTS